MGSLTTAATISRDSDHGGPTALNLHSGAYRITRNGFSPGHVTWRRDTVESRFVPGRALMGAVKDVVSSSLSVRVTGSTQADCQAKIADLCLAFDQFSYTLTITLGSGTPWVYTCEAADYDLDGGSVDSLLLTSKVQVVTFEIPRDPIPTTGPF